MPDSVSRLRRAQGWLLVESQAQHRLIHVRIRTRREVAAFIEVAFMHAVNVVDVYTHVYPFIKVDIARTREPEGSPALDVDGVFIKEPDIAPCAYHCWQVLNEPLLQLCSTVGTDMITHIVLLFNVCIASTREPKAQ